MNMTDTISDMLTRFRNALVQKHDVVSMPVSQEKKAIAKILKDEGFITDYAVEGDGQFKELTITLKYTEDKQRVITGLRRISKPGLRVYAHADELPRVRDFRGVSDTSFDGRGNYTLGIKEQIIFPEIDFDKVNRTRGMDVVIVTTANTNEESKALLKGMGMPFKK